MLEFLAILKLGCGLCMLNEELVEAVFCFIGGNFRSVNFKSIAGKLI
jgi:hypothetical protein